MTAAAPETPAVTPGQAQIVVNVTGVVVPVTPQPGWSIGAIATHARWQAGCGSVAFDNWEYRTRDGRLLDPSAPPGALDYLTVVRLAGIGEQAHWEAAAQAAIAARQPRTAPGDAS